MVQILLALLAGILTVSAPCILLPLPILFGASVGQTSKTRPIFITLGFITTFSILALGLQYAVSKFGINPNYIRNTAAFVLLVMSGFMIWPKPFEILMSHMSGLITKASGISKSAGSGNAGGFITGVVIGAVWAPCAGPILASIITLIIFQQETFRAGVLLIAYAIGAGIPMLLIAYGGQTLTTRIKSIAKYSNKIQQAFGVILIFVATSIFFQYDTYIQAWLLERVPFLGAGLEKSILGEKNLSEVKNKDNSNTTLEEEYKERQSQTVMKTELDVYGKAPEIRGITNWINSNPLTLAELKGKVVLVDFWTYSCINCIRTLPYVTNWYNKYKDQGFVVIGIHAPEFEFEKINSNVEKAVKLYNIHYPVAQDNGFATWRAYSNQFWPAHYLIDKNGDVVYTHFGEGKYEITENNIRYLLGLEVGTETTDVSKLNQIKSPEMYFGLNRLENLSSGQRASADAYDYIIPNRLDVNNFALSGKWKFDQDKAIFLGSQGKIKLHFNSAKVHMVAESSKAQTILVKVDDKPPVLINIAGSDLYTLFDSEEYREHVMEITIPEAGFEAFTFTFG